jgi:hypothetical protein
VLIVAPVKSPGKEAIRVRQPYRKKPWQVQTIGEQRAQGVLEGVRRNIKPFSGLVARWKRMMSSGRFCKEGGG